MLDDLATDEAENDADMVGMLLNFEPEVEIGLPADGSCGLWWDRPPVAVLSAARGAVGVSR